MFSRNLWFKLSAFLLVSTGTSMSWAQGKLVAYWCRLYDSDHKVAYYSDVFFAPAIGSTKYGAAFEYYLKGSFPSIPEGGACFFSMYQPTSTDAAKAERDHDAQSEKGYKFDVIMTTWKYQ